MVRRTRGAAAQNAIASSSVREKNAHRKMGPSPTFVRLSAPVNLYGPVLALAPGLHYEDAVKKQAVLACPLDIQVTERVFKLRKTCAPEMK
jgi:hypothetical protein